MDINTKTPVDSTPEFDDIRAYRDAEIPAAVKRISEDSVFPAVMGYLFEGEELERQIAGFPAYASVAEFQIGFMQPALRSIIRRTTEGLECGGFGRLEKGKAYLFVSNHRDILLDAALLQLALYDNGLDCSEITFGDNLMQPGIVTDFGKSNRMFKVVRGGNTTDFYRESLLLSKYIRYCISERKQSVWIAQSNGRNKDGVDKTNPTVLKMLSLSGGKDFARSFGELNIVPMSISYEWETCDAEKVAELYISGKRKYVKAEGEDLRSILKGIMSPKGRVHISIGRPFGEDDAGELAGMDRNSAVLKVAEVLDRRIKGEYSLFGTNYIAYDMLYRCDKYAGNYSVEEYDAFAARMKEALGALEEYPLSCGEMERIYLELYSNPVKSKEEL